jgi:Dolichyl-phosphate-mannose-protein mannosyltransferase
MVTIASRRSRRPLAARLTATRVPMWIALVYSRVIVLTAGAVGVLATHRIAGWEKYDPHRLSSSLGSVGNVLAGSAFRWDALGYTTIAQHGYTTARGTILFPLYPLLIRALTVVVGSAVIAGMLISLSAFAVGLALVHRIASEELGRRVADATVLLLAFSPFAFVFSAVYTESLLLALLSGAFYAARRDQFVLACVLAAAAALTHIQGVMMVAPLAYIYWNSRGRTRRLRGLWSPSALALALPVLALGGFFFYTHSRGWGWLAPITHQDVVDTGRSLVGTPITIIQSVNDMVVGFNQTFHGVPLVVRGGLTPGPQNLFYLAVLTIAILALISAWQRLPKEYALFAVLVILLCTSSAVATEPLKGLDRYMLPIFPLWIGAAAWLQKRGLMPVVLTISTLMLVFYTVEFTRWVSVF